MAVKTWAGRCVKDTQRHLTQTFALNRERNAITSMKEAS